MVYMMSTTRAGRPNKEKTPKTHTQNSKTDGQQKFQPSSEQLRMAQMTKSTNKSTEDPEIEAKIDQLTELTGRSKEQAFFVLHDCDYDLQRAVEKLFENEDKGEWQEMKTKKKKSAAKSESEPVVTEDINNTESQESANHKDRDYSNERPFDRAGSAPRNRRNDKAPPRFQRAGRGRNQNDDSDRFDRGDSQSRDRGRGRGRGSSRGRGRGRGGRRGDGNRDRGSSNFDDGPGLPIDTWTNEVAEEKKDNSFGNWGDMAEDWTTDEWQGSLKETTVFTSSEATKMYTSDNDAKMFSVTSIETQAFNSSNSMPSPPRHTDNYQHSLQQSSLGPDPLQSLGAPPKPIGQNAIGQNSVGQGSLGQNSIGQAPIGQNSSMGQSSVGSGSMGQNSLGQRLDIGMLLSGKPEYKAVDSVEAISQQTAELTKETANFMAQFQKNLAAESIKNAVGIGSSSSQSTGSLNLGQPPSHGQPSTGQPQVVPTQQPTSQQPSQPTTSMASVQQSQPKQQRTMRSSTKLPPPSKIPASAVVMPGSGSGSNFGGNLDVEFGCFSESPGGFSFGGSIPGASSTGVSNTYSSSSVSSSLNNHLNKPEAPSVSSVMTSSTIAVTSQQQQTAAMSAMLESMTQQQNSQSTRPAVFPNTPATPPKDYSQSSKISSPPDPIPFPSQTDRKSPYQCSGSLSSDQTSTGQLSNYSQASYTNSAYQSSNYKSNVPPTAITSSPSAGSSYSGSSNLTASSLTATGLQNYQPSSFQSQQQSATVGSGYSSGSSHQGSGSSLYQSNTNQPSQSSFQSQSASYNSQSSAGVNGSNYQTQNSYHHTRDSQSAPAFQSSSVTQTGSSAYQSSASQSSSSYQRDNSQTGVSQSGYGSQLSYGSVSVSGQNPGGVTSSKLSESLGKLTVKDNSNSSGSSSSTGSSSLVDKSLSAAAQYDSSTPSAVNNGPVVLGASLSTSTNTTASSVATGSVTVSAAVGISTNNSVPSVGSVSSTQSSSTSSSTSKSSAPVTTKAPVNLPPGIPPLIGHGQTNYMIGQPGFPIAAFGLQQPMYSYEDLLHQRLPMHGFNYDNLASFQHTATTLTGMDQSKLAAAAAAASYTAADASKLNRLDAQSPVNAQSSQSNSQTAQQQSQQQQTQQQTAQSAAHGQAFIPNPTAGLPGYYNYYVGGLPQAGYSYPTPFLPVNNLVPTVTNAGVTTTNTQFQKPAYNYGTGYDSLSAVSGQTHDFTKAYGAGASQSQNKASVNAASLVTVSSNSDLSGGAATGYPKAHQQASAAFDKSGFAAGTPPPFNMPPGLPTGTQAGTLSGAPYMAQYAMPAAAMAHPGQMLHQLHQDTSGSSNRASQQSTSQPKSLVGTKGPSYTGYWGN